MFTIWDMEREKEQERKEAKRRSEEKSKEAYSNVLMSMTSHEHVAKKPRLEEPLGSGPSDTVPTKLSVQETSREVGSGDESRVLDRKALREWWIRERGIWLDI